MAANYQRLPIPIIRSHISSLHLFSNHSIILNGPFKANHTLNFNAMSLNNKCGWTSECYLLMVSENPTNDTAENFLVLCCFFFLIEKMPSIFANVISVLEDQVVVFSFSVSSYMKGPKPTQKQAVQQFQSSQPHINN